MNAQHTDFSKKTGVAQPGGHTRVVALLRELGISNRGIARQLGRNQITINNALDPDKFMNVNAGTVLRVRQRIERLLCAAGWTGKPSELWDEYDEKLDAAA